MAVPTVAGDDDTDETDAETETDTVDEEVEEAETPPVEDDPIDPVTETDETGDSDDAGLFDSTEDADDEEAEEAETTPDSDDENVGKDDIEEEYVELDEETASMFDSVEGSSSSGDDDEEVNEELDGLMKNESNEFGTAYVEGMAKVVLLGLEEDDRDGLEDELVDTFETFRLGHFAGRVWEEKIMADAEAEIDPVWGLVGSTALCILYGVYRRPDGNEKMKSAINKLRNRGDDEEDD